MAGMGLRFTAALAGGALAIAATGCGSASPAKSPSGSNPGASGVPAQGSGCVSQSQAEQIWTDIDNKINAMEADPTHASPATVTTGAALQGVQQYLAQDLEANKWTEREVDHLESLTVVNAGCNNSTLQLRVTMTLVTDEYLNGSGQVDHHDPSEGQQLHFVDEYVRSGVTWKESNFINLDQPGPTPPSQII
jgi:hypothetical protein